MLIFKQHANDNQQYSFSTYYDTRYWFYDSADFTEWSCMPNQEYSTYIEMSLVAIGDMAKNLGR